jgi:hypothetical protein
MVFAMLLEVIKEEDSSILWQATKNLKDCTNEKKPPTPCNPNGKPLGTDRDGPGVVPCL